jgi:hypothetical protein
VESLIEKLRSPEGPFDGVLCFSQGGIAWRHFYTITQIIDWKSFTRDSDAGMTTFDEL